VTSSVYTAEALTANVGAVVCCPTVLIRLNDRNLLKRPFKTEMEIW
jgi:hypothetical protein